MKKINRRSFLKIAGAATAVSAMAACSSSESTAASSTASSSEAAAEPAASPVTITYAEVNPETTIVGKIGLAFKEKLEELSEGMILVDYQASGVLGSETDVLDLMLAGDESIDVARISAFALTSYGTSKVKVLAMPYVFVSREHFWTFAESDLAAEVMAETADLGLGVRTILFGEEGFRHFFSSKTLDSMDDLKGQVLRVSNDPIMNGIVESFGATPTVVDWGELYSGLDTGVCDGAEQPIVNYEANSFQEVAPNLILNAHTLGAIQIIVSEKVMATFTAEQQDMVLAAAAYAGEQNAAVAEADEATVLQGLIDGGYGVVDGVDKDACVAACADVVTANLEDEVAEDVYNQIMAMA